jgi:hypothetical protein
MGQYVMFPHLAEDHVVDQKLDLVEGYTALHDVLVLLHYRVHVSLPLAIGSYLDVDLLKSMILLVPPISVLMISIRPRPVLFNGVLIDMLDQMFKLIMT